MSSARRQAGGSRVLIRRIQQVKFVLGWIQSAFGQLHDAFAGAATFCNDLTQRQGLWSINFQRNPASDMAETFGESQAVNGPPDQ
jgi:hypothetical protein